MKTPNSLNFNEIQSKQGPFNWLRYIIIAGLSLQ